MVRRGGVPWEWGAVCPCRGLLAQRGNAGGRVLMPRAHGRGWYREKEIIDQADNDLERGEMKGRHSAPNLSVPVPPHTSFVTGGAR